jgi:mannose-6-phosphate isomerase-like protein (cupin superfamily)
MCRNWEKHGATMQNPSFEVINLSAESATGESYDNHSIAGVNDHEVRISIMTEAYHWHCHPDSDEMFLALEGGLIIDFDDQTVELLPGNMITVHRGVRHRTRPIGARSVNLTFERAGARSETLPSPRE